MINIDKYKKGQFVKYDFNGISPKRYKMLLIDGKQGDYYTYRLSIQLPRLPLTDWYHDDGDSPSFVHMYCGLYRDEECIQMERQLKLERIIK